MNRFRNKKKAKETSESLVRASTESEAPSIQPVKKSKTFGRGKKNPEPEPKPELDLANALPPSDDFRTSLLMNGLSARFSMLREQDDPKSKIGKASDDSVLFPKRQSRFNDLAFQSHGLSDIAEVASINGSIRPPFAITRKESYDTTGSFGTDDDSTHGSIMNRSKPGEGNNLFGGRQKIYKIPVTASGSTRSLAEAGGSGMGGRALYGDDVSQSAFQKLRERERQQEQERERERLALLEQEESEAQSSRPPSPPLSGYNRDRETSSTTSSGGPSNTRTSTAATSFTSQRTPSLNGSHTPITPGGSVSNGGLERSTTKARRLYETGLDQHLHEQQFSAMNRIDTLTRQRTLGGQTPPLVNSPTNIPHQGEKWGERRPIAGQASMPNLRAASPPPNVNPLNTFDFAIRSNAPETKSYGMVSPPLSPPMSEHDDPAILPVQPNDRGKATALGAFAKPVQPYDENKYSQRQLQMQQGRKSPPIRKNSPPRTFPAPHQQPMGRTRAESNATFASGRSRSNSSAQRHFLPSDRIPEAQSPPSQPKTNISQNRAIAKGAFLSSPDESIMSSPAEHIPKPHPRANPQPLDLSRMNFQDRNVNLQRPPESQHPANRQRPIAENPSRVLNESNNIPAYPQVTPSESEIPPAEDSPTLGPTPTMTGLSGMVRQHLRSDSNNSSIYGGSPSAGLTSRFPVDSSERMADVEYNRRSNPWDNEDWDKAYHESYEPSDAQAINGAVPASLSFPSTSASTEQAERPSWERELDAHHTRDGSTETQKERQHFKNDLAERRKRVQENLKSFVETESRSASPLPGSEWSKDENARNAARSNPLGLLKSKSRRGSLVGRPKEPSPASQAKAMKMMGLGTTTISSSPSPAKQSFEANYRNQANGDQASHVPNSVQNPGGPVIPPQTKAFRQARRDAQRDRERQVTTRHQPKLAREADRSEWPSSPAEFHPRPNEQRPNEQRRENVPPNIRTRQRSPSRDRKPPPVMVSHRNGSQESKGSLGSNRSGSGPPSRASRDRSSSDASGRSKSRNGRYKDDLAKAMAEGISSSSQGMYDELEPPPSARFPQKSPGTPSSQYQPSPVPSPMIMGPNGRSRSNSRATTGYFESQTLQPLQTNVAMAIGTSPRPSPTAPFSINSTPAQPSPAVSTATTPTTQGFQPLGHRKKSVNKSDISEPRFVSSTSRVTTINLPPEASLQNGMEAAPPIPPVNPMRRQTRRMFGLKKDSDGEVQLMPAATQSTEEMSTFSADEGDSKPKSRKLRKSSSEGGNLNARARQAVNAQPSPAMPSATFSVSRGDSPPRPVDGGMF